MPKLVRLYIVSVARGFAAAAVFVALLLACNVAGLGHLVMQTSGGWIGGLMLFIFNGIVFAGVQFGVAVMQLAEREDDSRGGPRGGIAVPVPVTVAEWRARSGRGRRSVPESLRSQVGTR